MRVEIPHCRHPLPLSEQLQCGPELQGRYIRHWPEAELRHLDLVVDKRPIAEAEDYDLLAPKRLLEP